MDVKTSADRDKRDRMFISDVQSRARMQGDTGRMYSSVLEWCDGTAGGSGAVEIYLRKLDDLLSGLKKPIDGLPSMREDWLLGMSGDEESVRVEVRRRYDSRKKKLKTVKESVDDVATNLAKEVVSDDYDHSLSKALAGNGPIHQRLFYLRLIASLKERQKRAEDEFKAAESALDGVDDAFSKYHDELVSTSKISLVEKVTGNKDYEQDAVPKFVRWFRNSVKKHQETSLFNDGLLDFYDDLVQALTEKLDKASALFDDLLAIREKLDSKCSDLLKYGVPREFGGEATEHVLDVEIFQDYLDPEHGRMWNWLFNDKEQTADYNPEEISASIQKAQSEAKRRRHVSEKVMDALVGQGRKLWQERIIGHNKPSGRDELGLNIIDGLRREAEWAIVWEDIKGRYSNKRPNRLPADEIEAALEDVGEARILSYISEKVSHAANKCQPFLQFDPSGKNIPPKKYICVYKGYRDDEEFKQRLTNIQGFSIKEGDLMITGDPKRVVFYWNEVGVPIYKVDSVNGYGASYENVKASELTRGSLYKKKVTLESSREEMEAQRRLFAEKKMPDIPLHTDRNWEGVFDPYLFGLFPITMRAIQENRGRLKWEQERMSRRSALHGAGEGVRLFALAVWAGAIKKTDEGYVINNDALKESDRELGKWRDTAARNFAKAKDVVQEWAEEQISEHLDEAKKNRDASSLESHFKQLKNDRVGMEDNEIKLVKQELEVLEAEINKLKGS